MKPITLLYLSFGVLAYASPKVIKKDVDEIIQGVILLQPILSLEYLHIIDMYTRPWY